MHKIAEESDSDYSNTTSATVPSDFAQTVTINQQDLSLVPALLTPFSCQEPRSQKPTHGTIIKKEFKRKRK